ncbi:ESPR domain-containing protein, partial [Burkholderia stagnalis]|uniref:ESPR domain-containing protein n=1 Tax=Burkholderia stagnalis TaxID=1503054 RepID=UPI000B0224D6
MNRTYRTIWNEALGAWVAASEISSARGKPNKSAVAKAVVATVMVTGAALLSVVPLANAATFTSAQICNSVAGVGPDGVTNYAASTNPVDGSGVWSNVAGCNANGGNFLAVTLFGSYTTAAGQAATAVGMGAYAAQFGTAVGHQATASGAYSAAFGFSALSSGASSYALGNGASATAANAVAIGHLTNARSASTVAIGDSNTVLATAGLGSTAIGYQSTA